MTMLRSKLRRGRFRRPNLRHGTRHLGRRPKLSHVSFRCHLGRRPKLRRGRRRRSQQRRSRWRNCRIILDRTNATWRVARVDLQESTHNGLPSQIVRVGFLIAQMIRLQACFISRDPNNTSQVPFAWCFTTSAPTGMSALYKGKRKDSMPASVQASGGSSIPSSLKGPLKPCAFFKTAGT